MKIFLDTASLKEIREAVALGVVDGITTNPSLLARETGDPEGKRPLTDIGLKRFLEDWEKAKKELAAKAER